MLRRLAAVELAATILGILLAGTSVADETLKLWYDEPAAEWTEALPIGNGRMGAMIFGGTERERIQFNDNTLFTGKPHDYAHDGAREYLPVLRQLLFDGKQDEAHALANRAFMSVSTRDDRRKIRQEKYQPFGDIILAFQGHANATDYRRELDIGRAVASVQYKVDGVTFWRELFASYPDNVIALRITADQPGQVNFNARLATPHETTRGTVWHRKLTIEGVKPDRAALVMHGKVHDGDTRFEAVLTLIPEGEQNQFNKGDGTITVRHADAATLLLVGASSFVNYKDIGGDPSANNYRTVEALKRKSYGELRDAHVADYGSLFNRVSIDLGTSEAVNQPTDQRIKNFQRQNDPQLASLFFQFGRYLLIASSRPGGQPANLQGLWNESQNPPWESKYTININTEMNYWPAELTGLSECHEPLFDAVKDLSQSGSRVADAHYGARGWVVHHNFDLWRGAAPINNSNHGIWPTGGAWLCEHLWYRYAFTGDEEFLRDTAYPLMKGAALFFVDYLIEDPRIGQESRVESQEPEKDDDSISGSRPSTLDLFSSAVPAIVPSRADW